jgi:hypothetical protein
MPPLSTAAFPLLTALLLAPGAAAEGQDERLSVSPSLRVGTVYDDNIFFEADDPESDVGAWVEPRIDIDWRRGRVHTGMDLAADLRGYASHSELNEVFYDLRGNVEWEAARGLLLRLADEYRPQAVRLGRPGDDVSNLAQSNLLRAEATWRRELARSRAIELGSGASWFTSDDFAVSEDRDGDGVYDDDDERAADHRDLDAFAEVQQGLGRRGLVYLRGEIRDRDYQELSESDYGEVAALVGMRGRLGRRLEYDFGVGHGWLDFDEGGRDSRIVGEGELVWSLPRDWTVTGSLLRRLTSDALADEFGETTARLELEKQLGPRTSASLGTLWSHYDREGRDISDDQASALELRLRRQLTRRIESVLSYRHWRNAGDNEDDDFHQNRLFLEFVYRR